MKKYGIIGSLKMKLKAPRSTLNLANRLPALLAELGPQARVMELGAGKKRRAPHITNADIVKYPEVDAVTDAHDLAFKKGSFDLVIVDAVLEHVADPELVVRQIYDVLKPGGYVYCELPFIQIYHPAPRDFRRYSIEGIEQLFDRFSKVGSGVAVGPASAFCAMLQEFVPFVIDIPVIRGILYYLLGATGFITRYLDLFLVRKKNAHMFASSLYYLGRK